MNTPHETNVTSFDPLARRKAAAEERVASALAAIEQAQRLIDVAVQALSSVNGLADEYTKLGALHDRVHRTWYVVKDKARRLQTQGRLTLDHEPGAHEVRWTRGEA